MGRTYAVILDSKNGIVALEDLPERTATAARIAVNKAADRARTESAKRVLQQVNLPASYVSQSSGRLYVSKRSNNSDLEAVVSARSRNTSLARFVVSKPRQGGARVMVKPGFARFLKGAIFVKLRSGNTDSKTNEGLAVRVRGGKRPDKAYKPVQLRSGLWLLYGPSVAQALMSAKDEGVWTELTPTIQDIFETEFLRQMDR